MSSLATHHPAHAHGFTSPSAPSGSSPSSPVFPHNHSLSLNGSGFHLALRPGTALGTSHLASPPSNFSSPTSSSTGAASPAAGVPDDGLDYASLPSWTDTHVAAWLSSALPTLPSSYADVFAQNDIRGSVLLEVDQTALKEMGVRSVGDRVKICVAVRGLRGKYMASGGGGTGTLSGRGSVLSRFANRPTSPLVNGFLTLSPPPTALATPPSPPNASPPAGSHSAAALGHSRPGSGSYSARSISVGNRIPPPLHLAQSNVNSHAAMQPAHLNPVSPPSRTTSPRSATFGASAGQHAVRQIPPAMPPPSTRIPPPPMSGASFAPHSLGSTGSGTTPNWLGDIPGLSTSGSSTSPSKPLVTSASSTQLRPSTAIQSSLSTSPGHRKASSGGARPSTAQASLSYSGHPYAAPSQLLPSPLEHPSSSGKSDAQTGYTVGRSTFARPSTAGGVVSSSGVIASSVSPIPLSNLDVMRKAVKFTSADGVTTRVLAVGDAKDGREVLNRVVKKFAPAAGTTGKEEDLEGWGVWTQDPSGAARLLTEQELYAICQNTAAPERTRGLFPSSPLQTNGPNKRGRKLQWVFGESHAPSAESTRPGGAISFTPSSSSLGGSGFTANGSPGSSPTSPNYLGIEIPKMGFEPASPSTSGSELEDEEGGGTAGMRSPPKKNQSGKMNRASTVSVMSGLEAPDWARDYYSGGEGASSTNGAAGQYDRDRPSTYMASPPQRTSSRRSPPTSHSAMVSPPSRHAPASRRSATEPHPTRSGSPVSGHSSLLPSSRKLRNFFGQRPPSELIATHLTEYFPLGLRSGGDKSERKLLSKQVRMSIRKSMAGGTGRRMSIASVASSTMANVGALPGHGTGTSWEKKEGAGESSAMSRFSGSSDGSGGLANATSNVGTTRGGGRSPRSSSGSALDPPDEADEEDQRDLLSPSPESASMAPASSASSSCSVSVTGTDDLAETRSIASSLAPSYLDTRSARLSTRRMSRMSGSSRLSVGAQSLWERRSKDSDAASVITVDEVTADLETRRASRASWGGAYSDDEGSDLEEEDQLDEDLSEEESEEETSGEEEDDEGEEGTPAKAENKGMKWIKGALIGAGSFGSVFLGMNPLTGSLMAVKQVELPTGNSHNEERKKSMLEALEREIELLKVLQHDNIVQYLDSSTDAQHLNIFLEYTAYTSKADIWSLGCLVVEMLTGAHPWANLTQMQAIFRIGSSVSPTIPDDISTEADDFLEQTFEIEHTDRPAAKELLVHPFIRDPEAFAASQQTPTRATFSQANSPL
ncbi:SPOSA6832_01165 [Sporobolomyces salmonicolor]|uniref:SPOSA6832_01165-mRNA-1:cds n=1 Tax=Sporidiobolus salmonicolor TaxID=5005 RepID=A0A0D6EI78_SPOSA|nr:SPOSA6832_01165 [Sporobolomyces salmonicolor]